MATITSTGPGLRSPAETGVEYNFVGLIVGKAYNYPQLFDQNNFESRYDLSSTRTRTT